MEPGWNQDQTSRNPKTYGWNQSTLSSWIIITQCCPLDNLSLLNIVHFEQTQLSRITDWCIFTGTTVWENTRNSVDPLNIKPALNESWPFPNGLLLVTDAVGLAKDCYKMRTQDKSWLLRILMYHLYFSISLLLSLWKVKLGFEKENVGNGMGYSEASFQQINGLNLNANEVRLANHKIWISSLFILAAISIWALILPDPERQNCMDVYTWELSSAVTPSFRLLPSLFYSWNSKAYKDLPSLVKWFKVLILIKNPESS